MCVQMLRSHFSTPLFILPHRAFMIIKPLPKCSYSTPHINFRTTNISYYINYTRAVEEGGAGGLSPPLYNFKGGWAPLYFLQTIYSSVKGSISKIKSPENRQLFMLIYWCFSKKKANKIRLNNSVIGPDTVRLGSLSKQVFDNMVMHDKHKKQSHDWLKRWIYVWLTSVFSKPSLA